MINVVIADDDFNARTGLKDMIDWDGLGATVVGVAEDGEQVVQLFKDNPHIDLAILDICMPYMDGLAVAKFIRESQHDTDIVLLSAHTDFEYAREALKYNIREYVTKPINRAKLNQLSNIVSKVIKDREASSRWRIFLHGTELQDGLKDALKRKDAVSLEKLIDIEGRFPGLSLKSYKEFYLAVLNLTRQMSTHQNYSEDSWKDCVNKIYEFVNIDSLKAYVRQTLDNLVSIGVGELSRGGTNIVELAKEYIDANILSSDIHSYNVASHLNLSVDHLSRLFKNAGENSLSDYIIEAKMDKAKDFLTNTSYPIRHVAEILGYTDPNYFVRVFKKKTGVTPTEYRLRAKDVTG